MNPINNQNFLCICKKFAKDLLMFIRETVSNINEYQLQWKKFEVLAEHYSCHINDANGNRAQPCSQKLCSMILEKLKKEDKWNGIKLLTEIFKVISLIYLEQTILHRRCVIRYVVYDELKFPDEDSETVLIMTALCGKSKYTKLLVNFNVLSSLNNDSTHLIGLGMSKILGDFMRTMGFNVGNLLKKKIAIFKIAEDIFFCGKYRSLKRMYLATIAIQAAQLNLKKEEITAKEIISCLRMYFTITRDPILTINEVRNMLYSCLIVLEKLHLFELLYEEFVKLLPECSVNIEPRNLTDLARCQIRENLKMCNLALPAAVVKLNLPPPLKKFVVGDVKQMSRKSGNMFPEQVITKSQLDEVAQRYSLTKTISFIENSPLSSLLFHNF